MRLNHECNRVIISTHFILRILFKHSPFPYNSDSTLVQPKGMHPSPVVSGVESVERTVKTRGIKTNQKTERTNPDPRK